MTLILVVDDDPMMAEGVREVLELAGHEVQLAEDGVEALGLLSYAAPDLVISDGRMPRMDGFEFCKTFRANPAWDHIPFIFLTGRSQDDDIALARRLGADDYLVKPCDYGTLLATVESKTAPVLMLINQSSPSILMVS